jgi:hypothetical protein
LAGRGFEVKVAGVFPSVPVDLKEWDVGQVGRSDFQDLSSILGEGTPNGWTSNDATEFKDSDSRKDLWFSGSRLLWGEGSRGRWVLKFI